VLGLAIFFRGIVAQCFVKADDVVIARATRLSAL
jgi:hypothetical protein